MTARALKPFCARGGIFIKRLEKILSGLHPELKISTDTMLIDDAILDSLDVVSLVTDINDAYKINIGAEDVTRDNFNTLGSISALIEKHGGSVCS